ncbi:MAG: L-threonine 3-dehydrogenase [Kiritimatiellae bacterium]|nr:L-threonine 3-dehydrogenase [Kiritimatiellia bacterium]
MKALVKKEAREGLWMQDIPIPEPGPNDVLIRILRTSICGTDVHIYNWDAWAQKTIPVPMAIGHEFVGRVVRTGAHVEGVSEGELVCGEGHIVCGQCRNCRAGRRHLCRNTVGLGVNRQGAFAEYLSLPVTNIWHADDRIPLDVLSCFDPFGNAVHTATQFPVLGEDVLITGAGPIGIMAAAIARHAGARNVVITDVNPYRLDLARRMGATLAVDTRQTPLDEVMRQLGMKEGFDVGMEMSGVSVALSDMINHMFHGGRIAILGIPASEVDIDWHKVIFNMLTLRGVYGREMFETWYLMTAMALSGLDISPVITHRLPFSEFQEGFEIMRSGKSGKIVLHWDE